MDSLAQTYIDAECLRLLECPYSVHIIQETRPLKSFA